MERTKEKILIADDHGVVRMGLSLMVRKLRPYAEIDEVDDYKQVMAIIKEKSFNLAILDLNMPNGNFIEALEAIKLKSPTTKVMIFSSQDENIYAVRYLKMGADGFLHKHSSEDVINKALSKMLDKGNYMSEDVKDALIFDKLNNNDSPQNPLEVLSDREMEIANRLVTGDTMKAIAFDLNIHNSTVSTYKTRILEKLNIDSIPALIKLFNLYHLGKD